ncbi:NAD(P)/FAD-dependent oxidoreductase [Paenibacillus abyssi]|uniref:Oxidoreductase n=1 Tax=Paenibacillus abyssi TaxID=1340531 RepID=A0A917FPA9_9BACL|nr:oxidoreductase [Paenibacillus abyssi]
MGLFTGNLYWPTTMDTNAPFPALKQNLRKQVAIIGGGMSGSICSYVLTNCGFATVMLEREHVAGGSTSANTGLLQFSNDIMLHELMKQIGHHQAIRFYTACREAVLQIGNIAMNLARDTGFHKRSSLYYASTEQHLPKLEKEFHTLRLQGFDVEFWTADDISARFPFWKPGAIVTHGDAEINPYRFVRSVTEAAVQSGLEVYENTEVVLHDTRDGIHRLETADGCVIEADYIVYAIGYEPDELRGKLIKASLNRSFVAVTAPQSTLTPWYGNYLIWETARPYLYMRTTPDGRAVIGGLDENKRDPILSESARDHRIDILLKRITDHFPMFDASIEYAWSATFGESRDNLPFIGEDPLWPGVYYCLGYGGNGTVYSMLAANLIRDAIRGDKNPIADIVKLDRPSLINS